MLRCTCGKWLTFEQVSDYFVVDPCPICATKNNGVVANDATTTQGQNRAKLENGCIGCLYNNDGFINTQDCIRVGGKCVDFDNYRTASPVA
jgi:phage FluMu protein Com